MLVEKYRLKVLSYFSSSF